MPRENTGEEERTKSSGDRNSSGAGGRRGRIAQDGGEDEDSEREGKGVAERAFQAGGRRHSGSILPPPSLLWGFVGCPGSFSFPPSQPPSRRAVSFPHERVQQITDRSASPYRPG